MATRWVRDRVGTGTGSGPAAAEIPVRGQSSLHTYIGNKDFQPQTNGYLQIDKDDIASRLRRHDVHVLALGDIPATPRHLATASSTARPTAYSSLYFGYNPGHRSDNFD